MNSYSGPTSFGPRSAERKRYWLESTAAGTRRRPLLSLRSNELPTDLWQRRKRFRPNDRVILNNRYQLEEYLDSGGMGEVYKATDLQAKSSIGNSASYIAIKVLAQECKDDPQARRLLQRELDRSKLLAHPNILRVYTLENDAGMQFISMEYVKGITLDKLVARHESSGLSPEKTIHLIGQVSQALSYAHRNRIVHSDLKPENIMVTPKGQVKILDFGLSRELQLTNEKGLNGSKQPPVSADDLAALTPAYASREMIIGSKPDVRDDIFALGCIAYELLSGKHPYDKIPADEAARREKTAKRIGRLERHQWRAIEKAIALKRKNRTTTVRSFCEEISGSPFSKLELRSEASIEMPD